MNTKDLLSILSEMRGELDKLEREYRWLHNAAYGSVGFSGSRGSGPSDPTLASVQNKQRDAWRKKLELADEQIRNANKAIGKAVDLVQETYRAKDIVGLPQTETSVSPDELARLRQAQQRRLERGEDFGEA